MIIVKKWMYVCKIEMVFLYASAVSMEATSRAANATGM